MRIAIVGTREPVNYLKFEIIDKIIRDSSVDDVIVTGDANGVDAQARICAKGRRLLLVAHAPWVPMGSAGGPARNALIADIADICHALPGPNSKGTWSCVNEFKKRNKDVRVYDWTPAPLPVRRGPP